MIKYGIGENAGIVWKLLSERGALTVRKIKEITKLDDQELMLALGWLSREHKIEFAHNIDDMHVSLMNSNFYF